MGKVKTKSGVYRMSAVDMYVRASQATKSTRYTVFGVYGKRWMLQDEEGLNVWCV